MTPLFSLALQAFASGLSSERAVLQEIGAVPGGCVHPERQPSALHERLSEVEEELRDKERSGQLRWRSGRAALSGETKSEFARLAPSEQALMMGSRDDLLAGSLGQWTRTSISDRNRMEPIAADQSLPISRAALKAARSASAGNRQVNPKILPNGILLRRADSQACRYSISISQPLRWKNWVFVSTGVSRGPLDGIGQTWALRREAGLWTVVAYTRDWIS